MGQGNEPHHGAAGIDLNKKTGWLGTSIHRMVICFSGIDQGALTSKLSSHSYEPDCLREY